MLLLVERGREGTASLGVGADDGLRHGVGGVGGEAEATEGHERRRVDAEASGAGDGVSDAERGVGGAAAGVAAIGLGFPGADHAEQGDDPLRAFRTVVEFGDREVALRGGGAAEGEVLVLDGVTSGDTEEEGLAEVPVDTRFTAGHVDVAGAGGGTKVSGRPSLGFLTHAIEGKHRAVVGAFEGQARERRTNHVGTIRAVDRRHPGRAVGDAGRCGRGEGDEINKISRVENHCLRAGGREFRVIGAPKGSIKINTGLPKDLRGVVWCSCCLKIHVINIREAVGTVGCAGTSDGHTETGHPGGNAAGGSPVGGIR